jgi:hypothetical protein
MKYSDGRSVKLGDRVSLSDDTGGVVVALIDVREYSEGFREPDWSDLKRGVLINFPLYGLIHYEEPEEDLVLIARKEAERAG